MNIKTLEVCSIVPAGEMAHRRWKTCTHTHTNHEYINGRHNRYCSECQVDLHPTENIKLKVQVINRNDIRATNIKLKELFNIKRRDTFICWNCYNTYRSKANNALSVRMFCDKCSDFMNKNRYYDSEGVSDLGLQGLRENTHRSNQIANGAVFTQGFNQDDNSYSGLGRYTYGHARKDDVRREITHINKAYADLNKGESLNNRLGRDLPCNWKCKVGVYVNTDGKYCWTYKHDLKSEYRNRRLESELKQEKEDLDYLWFDNEEDDIIMDADTDTDNYFYD